MQLKLKSNTKEETLVADLEPINLYQVTYLYKTNRGNLKERSKNVISNNKTEARFSVINHINAYNANNPHRKLSNVHILGVEFVEGLKLIIE